MDSSCEQVFLRELGRGTFAGPKNKDYSMWGTFLISLYLWKLPGSLRGNEVTYSEQHGKVKVSTPIMENHVEKDMSTGCILGFLGRVFINVKKRSLVIPTLKLRTLECRMALGSLL